MKLCDEAYYRYTDDYQVRFLTIDYEEWFSINPYFSLDFDYKSSDGEKIVCRYVFNVSCKSEDFIRIIGYKRTDDGTNYDENRVLFNNFL